MIQGQEASYKCLSYRFWSLEGRDGLEFQAAYICGKE